MLNILILLSPSGKVLIGAIKTFPEGLNKFTQSNDYSREKVIMGLSFNPVVYETTKSLMVEKEFVLITRTKKENTIYKNVFISKYDSSIWQPPKIS